MSEPTREQLLAEVEWLRGAMRSSAYTLTGATDGPTDIRVAREVVKATADTLNRVADESGLDSDSDESAASWAALAVLRQRADKLTAATKRTGRIIAFTWAAVAATWVALLIERYA